MSQGTLINRWQAENYTLWTFHEAAETKLHNKGNVQCLSLEMKQYTKRECRLQNDVSLATGTQDIAQQRLFFFEYLKTKDEPLCVPSLPLCCMWLEHT